MFPLNLGALPIMGMSRIMPRPIIPIMPPCPDEPWHIEQGGISEKKTCCSSVAKRGSRIFNRALCRLCTAFIQERVGCAVPAAVHALGTRSGSHCRRSAHQSAVKMAATGDAVVEDVFRHTPNASNAAA
jgi:hypothetical protein